jgi:O-antigen/teichoic acid export membrane protein
LNRQNQYRQILKATSLFGGVQLFQVLITIIRGKAVAVLLGPAGMGVNSLLQTSIRLIQNSTNLGLPQAAVRDISSSLGDKEKQRYTYSIFRYWIIGTALLGFIVTFIGAPLWSQYAFEDRSYTWAYRLISITFFFGAIAGGVFTVLRGNRKLRALASSNIISSIIGLIVALPLYYYFGIDGIVPAFIAIAFCNFLVAMYFKTRVLDISPIKLEVKDAFRKGLPMVKLGLSMSIAMIFTSVSSMTLLSYISHFGQLEDVGLYGAAQTITMSYTSMIFSAMATDYYPRLSSSYNNGGNWEQIVKQQAELITLIIVPAILLIISTAPILIQVLLSLEFLQTVDYILAASFGIFIKAPVWALGYIIISSGKRKLFLTIESIIIVLQLILSILGYKYGGLLGLGLGFSLSYIISFVLQLVLIKSIFGYLFDRTIITYIFFGSVLIGTSIILALNLDYPKAYWYIIPLTIIGIVASLLRLNQVIGLSELFSSFFRRPKR